MLASCVREVPIPRMGADICSYVLLVWQKNVAPIQRTTVPLALFLSYYCCNIVLYLSQFWIMASFAAREEGVPQLWISCLVPSSEMNGSEVMRMQRSS